MKRISIILAIAAAVIGCSRNDALDGEASREVKFVASYDTYGFTRATESSLEAGDNIRIIAGTPINAVATATVTAGNGLELSSPIYWVKDQTTKTNFVAIYPDEGQTVSTFEYNLLYEGAHNFEYHNLYMAATADANPNTTVALKFRHPFSKIFVNVTNKLDNDPVSQVSVNGVLMNGTLNLSEGSVSTEGVSPVNVEATKLADNSYGLIVMPQTAAPRIVVTTESGKTFTFVLASAFEFKAGAAATASLTLNPSVTPPDPEHGEAVGFSFTVTGWEDGGSLAYELNDPKWSIIGTVNGSDWSTDFDMTQTSTGTEPWEGVWEADITYAAGNVFKLRWDKGWDRQAGMATAWLYYALGEFDSESYLVADSNSLDIVLGTGLDDEKVIYPEDGSYHVKFIHDGYKLVVTKNE